MFWNTAVRIIVISLKTAVNRRHHIEKQMADIGAKFEFFDALTIDDITAHQLDSMLRYATGPTLTKHIGCCLSHKNVWKVIAESTEPVAVLEDDVHISSNLPDVLTAICSMILPNEVYDFEFVGRKHLIARQTHWTKNVGLPDECTARRCYLNKNGAGGYALVPNTAKRLALEAMGKFFLNDAWMYSRPWLKCYLVEPMAVIQSTYTSEQAKQDDTLNLNIASPLLSQIGPVRWHPRARLNRLMSTIQHLPSIIQSIGQSVYEVPKPAPDLFRL